MVGTGEKGSCARAIVRFYMSIVAGIGANINTKDPLAFNYPSFSLSSPVSPIATNQTFREFRRAVLSNTALSLL